MRIEHALICASLIVAAPMASACSRPEAIRRVDRPLITDTTVGTGAKAAAGKTLTVHYTGWLYDAQATDHHGRTFDSSRDRQEPISFRLGNSEVISGWDRGFADMRVGGARTLVIAPELAYGPRGAEDIIPPNATLLFDVELLDVR